MQVARHRRGSLLAGGLAESLLGRFRTVFERRQQVCARTDRRIEDNHIGFCEAQFEVETLAEQLGHQPYLRLDHFNRRVVDTALLAQFRVVGGKEVLVEVEPDVAAGGVAREYSGVDRAEYSLEQGDGGFHLRPRSFLRKHSKHFGQKVVPGRESIDSVIVELRLSLDPCEQQGVGDRLSVGVGELSVGGVREEDRPPLAG